VLTTLRNKTDLQGTPHGHAQHVVPKKRSSETLALHPINSIGLKRMNEDAHVKGPVFCCKQAANCTTDCKRCWQAHNTLLTPRSRHALIGTSWTQNAKHKWTANGLQTDLKLQTGCKRTQNRDGLANPQHAFEPHKEASGMPLRLGAIQSVYLGKIVKRQNKVQVPVAGDVSLL
jgi:hypothetical protein